MAQLFIVGMVVGYMKDQIKNIRNQDEDQIQYLNGQLGDMSDINDSNVRIKHTFERQIVNQKDSLGKIYEITSQLDQRGPEEVLFYAAQMCIRDRCLQAVGARKRNRVLFVERSGELPVLARLSDQVVEP